MNKVNTARLFALLAAAFYFGSPHSSAADGCREGQPLLHWVSTSDVIAIIETTGTDEPVLVYNRRNRYFQSYFRFLEVIKPGVLGAINQSETHTIFFPKGEPQSLLFKRRYLAFLQLVEPGIWRVRSCGYLAFMPGNKLRDACNAITDLYGENPYEREARCLLNYPPSAPAADVGQEIRQALARNEIFAGTGRVVEEFSYRRDSPFQELYFEPDARTRRKYFRVKALVKPVVLKAYLRTGDFPAADLARLGREGRRIEFSGRWQQGSLILEKLE